MLPFATRLAELTIRHLVPKLFRELFAGNEALMAAALRCEKEGTVDAARAASDAARAASDAARAASDPDGYLKLSADLALQVLKELKSPGVEFIEEVA